MHALKEAQKDAINIDIVAFDACLMGMTEIAYEIKDYTDYFISFPGNHLGTWLVITPQHFSPSRKISVSVTAEQLSQAMVESFGNQYAGNYANTLSAINTSGMDRLMKRLNRLQILFLLMRRQTHRSIPFKVISTAARHMKTKNALISMIC